MIVNFKKVECRRVASCVAYAYANANLHGKGNAVRSLSRWKLSGKRDQGRAASSRLCLASVGVIEQMMTLGVYYSARVTFCVILATVLSDIAARTFTLCVYCRRVNRAVASCEILIFFFGPFYVFRNRINWRRHNRGRKPGGGGSTH